MGEPALRDCDDPADLPLFAPVPASRPGRVRSTFSMRLDPAATKDDVQTSQRRRRPPCWSRIRRLGGISRTGPDA
jgi:hypothetical protein